MRIGKVVGIISALALIPVLPCALLGYSGNDFQFHVTSWMDLRDAWASGQFMPGWAERSAFTWGDPHFCFYPPVSLGVGTVLTLLFTLRLAPAAFIWLSLFMSGMAMYIASKLFVAEESRLGAALLYMLGPYTITLSLVRFAAGEMLVQAWLPLILLWLYQATWNKDRRAWILLGCLLGLSWITNIPASLMMLYGLAAVTGLWAWDQRSLAPMLRLALAELLAGVLAAFYLAPVWLEQKWIKVGNLGWTDARPFLLFMSRAVNQQSFIFVICWIVAVVEIFLIAACVWYRRNTLRTDRATRSWLYLSLVSFFFQLPLSLFLWRHLPELRLVQFPFRFLGLMGVALPLIVLAEGTRPVWRRSAVAIVALMAFLIASGHFLKQYKTNRHAPRLAALQQQWEHEGYIGEPEYVPVGSTPTATEGLAPASKQKIAANPGCKVALETRGYDSKIITTDSPGACEVRLATFFYPYWHAVDESGKRLSTADSGGRLLIMAPAGMHTVLVEFRPSSTARLATGVLSLVGWVGAVLGLAFSFPRRLPTAP